MNVYKISFLISAVFLVSGLLYSKENKPRTVDKSQAAANDGQTTGSNKLLRNEAPNYYGERENSETTGPRTLDPDPLYNCVP